MTPLKVSIAASIASVILLLVVFELIRSRRLRERYALLWLLTGLVLLVLSAWRGGLNTIAELGRRGDVPARDPLRSRVALHPRRAAALLDRHLEAVRPELDPRAAPRAARGSSRRSGLGAVHVHRRGQQHHAALRWIDVSVRRHRNAVRPPRARATEMTSRDPRTWCRTPCQRGVGQPATVRAAPVSSAARLIRSRVRETPFRRSSTAAFYAGHVSVMSPASAFASGSQATVDRHCRVLGRILQTPLSMLTSARYAATSAHTVERKSPRPVSPSAPGRICPT